MTVISGSNSMKKARKRDKGCQGCSYGGGGQRRPFWVDEVSEAAVGIHGGQTLQLEKPQCKGSKTRACLVCLGELHSGGWGWSTVSYGREFILSLGGVEADSGGGRSWRTETQLRPASLVALTPPLQFWGGKMSNDMSPGSPILELALGSWDLRPQH